MLRYLHTAMLCTILRLQCDIAHARITVLPNALLSASFRCLNGEGSLFEFLFDSSVSWFLHPLDGALVNRHHRSA
ncbi:uncharacterized protein LAESUDRAFT_405408 [Laetiporus sulphureus 93-53]|uniref:Secreted protein n=1 Tax=Laetiporus sulphureus 93-53 TaxID=1314785 RepID=A0A165CDA9_9APHY|nr:uncharacterized protein LAESUDRAFT_405408 [Laetiporus sulphureus 93-53]KZT02606.1 hypothetical protein LAESUDRAFT_405408 [Laetiporus sulphureus 93-53]